MLTLRTIPSDEVEVLTQQPPLGRGASAVVYRGVWRGLPVAVKRFHHGHRHRPRPPPSLAHEHLVAVYGTTSDGGGCGGGDWVLEALPQTLQQQQQHSGQLLPVPADRAVAIALDVAKALLYLHTVGVVHGNVGAPHVLLNRDGLAKLSLTSDAAAATATFDDDMAAYRRLLLELSSACNDAAVLPTLAAVGRRVSDGFAAVVAQLSAMQHRPPPPPTPPPPPPPPPPDALLHCPVCLEALHSVHLPKLLPCGHSCCLPCLRTLAEPSRGTVRCPECRVSTRVSTVEALATNYRLQQLAQQGTTTTRPSLQPSQVVRLLVTDVASADAATAAALLRTLLQVGNANDAHTAAVVADTLQRHASSSDVVDMACVLLAQAAEHDPATVTPALAQLAVATLQRMPDGAVIVDPVPPLRFVAAVAGRAQLDGIHERVVDLLQSHPHHVDVARYGCAVLAALPSLNVDVHLPLLLGVAHTFPCSAVVLEHVIAALDRLAPLVPTSAAALQDVCNVLAAACPLHPVASSTLARFLLDHPHLSVHRNRLADLCRSWASHAVDEARLQENAAVVLRRLCETMDDVAPAGFFEAAHAQLIGAMRAHPDDDALHCAAVRALQLVDADAITPEDASSTVALLRPSDSTEACRVLRALARDPAKHAAVVDAAHLFVPLLLERQDDTALDVLVRLAESSQPDGRLVPTAQQVLELPLVSRKPAAVAAALCILAKLNAASTSIDAIVAALAANPHQRDVQCAACSALASVLDVDPTFALPEGTQDLVLQTLKNHPSDFSVQTSALDALEGLAPRMPVGIVTQVMRSCPWDARLQSRALGLLLRVFIPL